MAWFESGLNKDQLSVAYKKLVKKWHPDVNQDNIEEATAKMKEINAEYDNYFVKISYHETDYNADDLFDIYKRAREQRKIVLAFLKRDKKSGTKGWYAFNQYGKITADDGNTWENFHGGFALCELKADVERYYDHSMYCLWFGEKTRVTNQEVTRLQALIETPTYGDMYFASKWGSFSQTSAISTTSYGQKAYVGEYDQFTKIRTKNYGELWLSKHTVRPGKPLAYLKVNGQVMSCEFDLKPEFYEIIETVSAKDFGFLQFQECTLNEFEEHFDVNYVPRFSESLKCKRLQKDEFYFIDDPIVAHYARLGIVAFYRFERNFKMRYGTFDKNMLREHIHQLSYDDADRIQDYLDKLNSEFEENVKGMIRKGKLKINI